MPAKDEFRNEKLEKLLERLEKECAKLGLYLQNTGVMTDGHENGPVFMQAVFLVGDEAFSEKVLDPEQDKIDREAEALFKQAFNPVEDIRSQLEQTMRAGKGVLDLDDEEEG